MIHRTSTTARIDASITRIDAWLDRLVGPLRAHRIGIDQEHGDEGHDHGEGTADILERFARQADALHEELVHDRGLRVVGFVGATGAGKTRLIERLIERTDDRVGVIVGDVAGEDDAERFRALGADVASVATGKECHLDPGLLEDALTEIDLDAIDRLYVENVGNMVCPADFPLGAQARVVVVSATEGDDVIRKHPLLFQAGDLAVINKRDVADAVNADLDRMERDLAAIAPGMDAIRTDAEHEAGIDALASAIDERVEAHSHQDADHDHTPGHDHGHD
ncbi:hydrogenase nickel incorporation protein HypB [Halococcoides cellulosivorans]|uniref:Hydrogenase accessory protein HypB n=1 Tax=Halococcoides cellulosivorans TaxID=1679096 RepID=A0A2R4WXQ7_9EURY|nr:hydrogenase nickel incorporation protein HypB [Halococcoides cellulosivorans]AWB26327.1 hydrogenase accessory protein HypB [Halococcoides cellulosivorans]